MRIQEFLKKEKSPELLNEINTTIAMIWQEFAKAHNWPTSRYRTIPYQVSRAVAKEYQNLLKQLEHPEEVSFQAQIETIAQNWNWKRSPAPLQILTSQKTWKGLTIQAQLEEETKEEGSSEAYLSVLSWTKNQIRINSKKDPETTERLIRELAQATLRLEELNSQQKKEWDNLLPKLITTHGK